MTYRFLVGPDNIPLDSLTPEEREETIRTVFERAMIGIGARKVEKDEKEKTA